MTTKEKIAFVDIPQYEGLYKISSCGDVYSCLYNKIMRPYKRGKYLMINLCKEGFRKSFAIHRLVGMAFIPNPDDKPEIDHIDTNTLNNNVENLHWVTKSENAKNPISFKNRGDIHRGERHHYYGKGVPYEVRAKMSKTHKGMKFSEEWRQNISNAQKGKHKMYGANNPHSVSVIQYTKQMIPVKRWECITEASKELHIHRASISNCLINKSKTAGGFIWIREVK